MHLSAPVRNWLESLPGLLGRGTDPNRTASSDLAWMLISHPFWWYSDLYSSPYFVPSQEPAFGPILDLRMPYRTHPHLPTIFAFPVYLRYYSRWHHLHDDYIIRYQHYHSPEASEHPPPFFKCDFQCPDFCLSVAMRATSYFGTIDSHDHYISRTSRFRAATSRCQSLLPNLAIRFPRLI